MSNQARRRCVTPWWWHKWR